MSLIFLPSIPPFRIIRNWLFGPGTDGSVTLDGVSSVPTWASYASSRYTLNRHIFCSNLQINNGIKLIPNGYGIFASSTLTFIGSGSIFASGESSGIYSPGTVPCAAHFFAAGEVGYGDTTTTRNGYNGTNASNCLGGTAGNGGDISPYTGGVGGVATPPGTMPTRVQLVQIVEAILASGSHPFGYAAGRGGGSGASGTNYGGGSGSGGSECGVFARHIVGSGPGTGSIQADGSRAGYASSSSGTYGGAGGGGGGIVWLATADPDYASQIDVHANGGALGLGYLHNGTVGSAGTIIAAVF